ncbi:MAG: hypothetical protein GX931_04025 [Acholeplasmataceae bacterium]|nr:hypothetical protein [Acholeplasmataceae bacterium]
MFKKLICILLLFLVGNVSACKEKEEEYLGDEVILDKNLELGIGILGIESITDLSTIHRYYRYSDTVPKNVNPIWRLMQWGTRYNFRDYGEETIEDGFYVIRDDTKEFKVNPETGEYCLNAFTALENPQPRVYGEPWLHLATEQRLSDMSRLDELEHVWACLDFEITVSENLMGANFNPDLHTALFQWVFIVKNDNIDSPDYHDYIWVNIPYFDARYDFSEEAAFLDFGKDDKSDTFIYSADSKKVLENKAVKVGERRRVVIDLKKYIEIALQTIQELPANANSEFPILLNTTLQDLRIESFYIGWEIPGTFNASATIYSNSLKYERKQQ